MAVPGAHHAQALLWAPPPVRATRPRTTTSRSVPPVAMEAAYPRPLPKTSFVRRAAPAAVRGCSAAGALPVRIPRRAGRRRAGGPPPRPPAAAPPPSACGHRASRGAHGGDLQLDPRMGRLAHHLVGVEQRAEDVEDLVERDGLAELSAARCPRSEVSSASLVVGAAFSTSARRNVSITSRMKACRSSPSRAARSIGLQRRAPCRGQRGPPRRPSPRRAPWCRVEPAAVSASRRPSP